MAPHSSTLAWKIPWTEETGRLWSMGSLRVRHNWATSLSLFTFMHWRRKCNPLQCSCLENPRDGGAWWAAVYGAAQSRTRLNNFHFHHWAIFTFTFHFHALETEMATHSSVLAWRIPGTAETGGLPSMGSHRVRQDWSDLAAAAAGKLLRQLHILFTDFSIICLSLDLFLFAFKMCFF